ncbi:hypothetical protein EDD86DRAFT_192926 [Gorgonomyces haynaldii]|nr:hypothetical protein EDD86DRAFT_192926 [Gorgonomyces haynaldii]
MLFVNSKTIKITQNVIYQWKVFGSLSHEAKQLCDSKVAECEEIMEEYIQGIQFTGSEDEKNRKITDFLINRLRLLTFRREYMKVLMGEDLPFKTEDHVKAFFEKYRMRILVPAIRQYHKLGSKGNATTTNLLVMTLAERAEINGTARTSFERCEREALQNEIQRNMTLRRILRARELLGMLSDERVGKLFREAGSVTVPSPADQPEFSFRITEEDYGTRSSIFNHFLADLFSSNNALIQELRSIEVAAIAKSNAKGNQKAAVDEATMRLNIIDDKRIYACKKEDLAKAVLQMAAQLNKWKQDRTMEQQKFMGALDTHLFETIRNCEKIILQQSQEKREQQASYKRDVRMLGSELAVDAFAEMASMEVELNELRKSRKVEERRIRNKIIDEYDSLVQELVREIAVVNGRFHEYQISNFNDIMNIMAESQKEQLGIMAANVDLPDSMREVANSIMEHQTQLEEYRQQNHDLKLTVLKIRSMFLMKEQALKAFFDSKLRKLQEDNKESQEKLWDSYRDAEARERTLRKQLAKMQKQKSSLEVQNETLQRQLREEQLKATQKVTGKSDRSQSAKSARTKSAEVEHKPKQTGVNVDHLLQELANKTALVEELLQEKRDRYLS